MPGQAGGAGGGQGGGGALLLLGGLPGPGYQHALQRGGWGRDLQVAELHDATGDVELMDPF